jgi:hypothetical protein
MHRLDLVWMCLLCALACPLGVYRISPGYPQVWLWKSPYRTSRCVHLIPAQNFLYLSPGFFQSQVCLRGSAHLCIPPEIRLCRSLNLINAYLSTRVSDRISPTDLEYQEHQVRPSNLFCTLFIDQKPKTPLFPVLFSVPILRSFHWPKTPLFPQKKSLISQTGK